MNTMIPPKLCLKNSNFKHRRNAGITSKLHTLSYVTDKIDL